MKKATLQMKRIHMYALEHHLPPFTGKLYSGLKEQTKHEIDFSLWGGGVFSHNDASTSGSFSVKYL